MAKIDVTAKIDGGVHLKYGEIKAGRTYTIDEEDFGEQLFHRPPGFESPHEKADRERREALENETQAVASPESSPSQDEPIHEEVN